MPVQETPLVPELLHIKKQSLDHSTNIEESLISIKEIGTFLSTLDLSSISKLDILLFDYLKSISREITNINVSYAEAKPILQNSLLAIVKIYAKCIRFYYSVNAFEIINELLQRHTEIFKKGHRSVTIDGAKIMEEEFKQNSFDSPLKSQWVKISSYSSETPFFYLFCHEIIQNINGVEKQFHSSSIGKNYDKVRVERVLSLYFHQLWSGKM